MSSVKDSMMTTIYGFQCTDHFVQKVRERRIAPYLIALGLAKGARRSNGQYVINKDQIRRAVLNGDVELDGYVGIETLTIVARENRLVTAYGRYSDSGLGV